MIPINRLLLPPRAQDLVLQCLREGWISSEGPWIERFEHAMARVAGRKHAVAVSSGSAAIDIAVAALRLGKGDEVILPSMTIISCANAVVRSGATPVFVDCEWDTWTIDPQAVENAVTPRTRAIMPVHLYGMAADMDRLTGIARRHGLAIIEDAAEAHGLLCGGRPCGSFGEISTFSFYANKHVPTGEGGMVVTDEDELASRARSLRNLCFGKQRFVHEEIGWNYRMGSLQAALGIASLEVLPATLERKSLIGAAYRRILEGDPRLTMQPARTDRCEHGHWVVGVVLDDQVPFDAAHAMQQLGSRGVATRPFFWPLHEQPVFRKMGLSGKTPLPISERLGRRGFYLPSGTGTTDTDISIATMALRDILN